MESPIGSIPRRISFSCLAHCLCEFSSPNVCPKTSVCQLAKRLFSGGQNRTPPPRTPPRFSTIRGKKSRKRKEDHTLVRCREIGAEAHAWPVRERHASIINPSALWPFKVKAGLHSTRHSWTRMVTPNKGSFATRARRAQPSLAWKRMTTMPPPRPPIQDSVGRGK